MRCISCTINKMAYQYCGADFVHCAKVVWVSAQADKGSNPCQLPFLVL